MANNDSWGAQYYISLCGCLKLPASANEGTHIYPVAFKNDMANTTTIVIINDNSTDEAIQLSGSNLPAHFDKYVTSAIDDCKGYGKVNSSEEMVLPANSVITLYKKI